MREELKTVEVPHFPGYFIRSDGKAFFADGREKIVSSKPGRSAKLIIRVNYKMYTLGFATLIAEAFLPNPWKHTRIIFKDRDHHNCEARNIAWVDNETYFYYCTHGRQSPRKGRPKIFIDREVAIRTCTDEILKVYYKTLDEHYLKLSLKYIDGRLSELWYWRQVKSEVYLYFIDRVSRFSILAP